MKGIQAIEMATMPRIIDASANPFRCRFGFAGDGCGVGFADDGAAPSGSTYRWPFVETSAVHSDPLWNLNSKRPLGSGYQPG